MAGPELLSYWRWSSSQLLDNAQRGVFAEYLVCVALGCDGQPRDEWVAYDAKSRRGVTVEVRSAAYRQNWKQSKPSDIKFGISPRKYSWNPDTGEEAVHNPPRRLACVYVFCVLGTECDPDPDPLGSRPVEVLCGPNLRPGQGGSDAEGDWSRPAGEAGEGRDGLRGRLLCGSRPASPQCLVVRSQDWNVPPPPCFAEGAGRARDLI